MFDRRTIHLVYDEGGNCGKSSFCSWMEYHGLGELLPSSLQTAEDLLAAVCDLPRSKCYLIDFPRCINKAKMAGFWAGIEDIKNGRCYDKRYNMKKVVFEPPQICVFTNKMPDWDMLSVDRWRMWSVSEGLDLYEREILDKEGRVRIGDTRLQTYMKRKRESETKL